MNPKRTTEWFRADELYVDPEVQRRLKPGRVKELCDTLDLDGLGVVTVNVRADGTKSLIDGQHRREALMQLGMGEWRLKCDTYWGLPRPDEHRKWRRQNNTSKASAWDDFRSGVAHNDQVCVEISDTCARHGFQVSSSKRHGSCVAIIALRKVHELGALEDTFAVIEAAWGSDKDAVDGKIIEGLGTICHKYNGELDRAALANKLGRLKPTKLIADARDRREYAGGSISHAISERVVDVYNRGRRTGVLRPL